MKYLLSIVLLFLSALSHAQEIEMADKMREEGKIYVVVAVITVILIGLLIYLISIDRKVKKLEDTMNQSS